MSNITANIIVESNEITITPQSLGNVNISSQPVSATLSSQGFALPGGNIGELQFNDGGRIGGTSNIFFDGSNIVSDTDTFKLIGGDNGLVLQTDGTGNLTWTQQIAGDPGNGSPGGANGQLQFNDQGLFGGQPGLTFNKTTNTLSVTTIAGNLNAISGTLSLVNVSSLILPGGANGQFLRTNGLGNLSFSNVTLVGGSNAQIQFNDDGELSGATNLFFDKTSETLEAKNITVASSAELGDVSNVKIGGGNNAFFLQTDGTGNLSWAAGTVTATGNGVSDGVAGRIQLSDGAGNFTSETPFGFTGPPGDKTLFVPGSITAQNLSVDGITTISAAREIVNLQVGGSTGTVNFDVLDSAIYLELGLASSDFTINIRGNANTTLNSILDNNVSLTCAYINRNGSTPYLPTTIQIDGATVTPVWAGGQPTVGTISGFDQFLFNIIKISDNSFQVFASRVGFE